MNSVKCLVMTLCLVAFVLPGCKKDPPPQQQPPPVKPAAKPTPKPQPQAKVGRPKLPPPKITAEQRKAYVKALGQGRTLAKEKRWGEAVTAFEGALKAIPMDGRALGELGWCAFHAGDLKRAREANLASVRAATEPKVQAAGLYNLGRVAEAQKKTDLAAGYYARSLALRPHKAVASRLATLTTGATVADQKTPMAATLGRSYRGCKKLPTLAKLCDCLKKVYVADEGNENDPPPRCEEDAKHKTERVRLLSVAGEDAHVEVKVLVALQKGGWSALTNLARVYNPGAFGIFEDFALESWSTKPLGTRPLLRMLTKHQRYDRDLGIAEEESRTVKTMTVCLLPADKEGEVSCPFQLEVHDEYERDTMHIPDEMDLGEVPDELRTKGLPLRSKYVFDVTFSEDGKATVVLKEGKKTAAVASQLGTHPLW